MSDVIGGYLEPPSEVANDQLAMAAMAIAIEEEEVEEKSFISTDWIGVTTLCEHFLSLSL